MQVSKYISGISPDFTLTRDGNEVMATFFYGLTGYYDEDLGYYLWDGELGAEIGAFANYLHQTADYPMDLELAATLAPGVTAAGSYFVNDNIGGASFDQKFNVTLFDVAANFTGTATVDLVFGSAAADTFRSVGSGDIFEGGTGNDLYRVYSADTQVVEIAGGGNDQIAAAVSYVLRAGVDVEQLTTTSSTGSAAINLTGNTLAQTIIGNAGDNILHDGGKGAADILRGLAGNDTYRIFNSGDTIADGAGQGADKVIAAVDYALGNGVEIETMQTNGSTGTAGIDLTGNGFDQSITGNAGNNRLDGKGGTDVLRGLGGKDTFVFSSALGAGNVDTIVDFKAVDDTIELKNTVFAAVGTGSLAASAFNANSSGTALEADDRIIYETDTGKLFYDADGNGAGAAVQFAVLTGNPTITAADFVVV
ncbi:calcium-binding protein [Kumtagia ephedrae]|uniref:Calcium-binding protein n=1 Tax=Kumtagia ephedrae TaxID=2116701 RepID=A0A2P7S5H8_9HYPH|nr:calcium-binding protein [Mesorhizobium ephedrae]PSJ57707.1 hypothetical protein C7I84_16895 [Mesorhizobium ephedrae]